MVERTLSNLTIGLQEGSGYLATLGQPIHFVVSMVTTSRQEQYLRVWYGDGHDNIVSLEDTESPQLVLIGNGREMEIVASYGVGCALTVEFQYIYETEGTFQPNIEVYEGTDGSCNADQDVDNIDKDENMYIEMEEDIGASNVNYFDFGGLLGNDYADYSESEESEEVEHEAETCKAENTVAEMLAEILVVQEIRSLKIHSPRIGQCDRESLFEAQVSSHVNVSFHWTMYRIVDEDFSYMYDDLDTENIGIYDIGADLIDEFSEDGGEVADLETVGKAVTVDPEFEFHFIKDGAYLLTVKSINAISSLEDSTYIMIQCPVHGLHAACRNHYIVAESELECFANVTEGSNVIFHWYIEQFKFDVNNEMSIEKTEVPAFAYSDTSSMLKRKMSTAWSYHITVTVQNNISSDVFYIEPAISVQEPISDVNVLTSKTLLGERTSLVSIYVFSTHGYSIYLLDQLQFGFDFGDGNHIRNKHVCKDSQMYCFSHMEYWFETPGKHSVDVYVKNNVSEYKKTVDVWVYTGLDNVTVEVVGHAVAGQPTRFVVLENGESLNCSICCLS